MEKMSSVMFLRTHISSLLFDSALRQKFTRGKVFKKGYYFFMSSINSEFNSEFNITEQAINAFDRSRLSCTILNLLNGDNEDFCFIEDGVNPEKGDIRDSFVNALSKGFSCNLSDKHENLLANRESILFDYGSCNIETVNVSEYFNDFKTSVERVKKILNRASLSDVANSFFNLSRNVIFRPQNRNLFDSHFRKSRILENLIRPAETEKLNNCFIYKVSDPFVAASLVRIADNIQYCIEKKLIENESKELYALRSVLFSRLAERAFDRYFHVKGETFRVSLNRHLDMLIAHPYDDLSSVEEVKPIRLFEKIKLFISEHILNSVVKDDSASEEAKQYKECKVFIIGHTEACGEDGEERELRDLMRALLNWYSDVEKTPLRLTIENIVHHHDYMATYNRGFSDASSSDGSAPKIFSEILRDNRAECILRSVDYNAKLAFNTLYLQEIIQKNDIVFILDCPWLTQEDLDIKKIGSLQYFCDEISGIETVTASNPRIDSYKQTIMDRLSSQYNRIMSTNTFDAGEICRVLKDHILDRIRIALKNPENVTINGSDNSREFNHKAVYLFTSETVGIQYSSYASYPLQRKEKYESKDFVIYQFCNYKVKPLPNVVSPDKAAFRIGLWSIIKYISIGYAYVQLRDIINECADSKLEPDCYFEVYRNIFVMLNTEVDDDSRMKVHVSVKFSSKVREIIGNEYGTSKLYNHIMSLIRALYSKVLFSNANEVGDMYMKTGFSMNLYSCADDVRKMYFWHKYRMACEKNDFSKFGLEFGTETVFSRNVELADAEYDDKIAHFQDKRIYDMIMKQLECNDSLTLGQKCALRESEQYYQYESSDCDIIKRYLTALQDVCQNTNLAHNGKNAIQEI